MTEVKYYVIDNLEDAIEDVIANERPNDVVYLKEENYGEIGDFLMNLSADLDPEYSNEQHWLVYGGRYVKLSEVAIEDMLFGYPEEFFNNLRDYLNEEYDRSPALERILRIFEV